MAVELFELVGDDDRRFSPYCWRARMALAHKGIEADYIPVGFTEKDRIAFSGQQLVPVLRDGEKIVSDSWEIACYLEDAYPDHPTLFGGAIGRGQARFFHEWAPHMSAPIMRTMLKDIFDRVRPEDRDYFRASREARFGKTLEELNATRGDYRDAIDKGVAPLRALLTYQPFLCGDAPAYADYILFGHFQTAAIMSPEIFVAPGDALYEWCEKLRDLFGGLGRQFGGMPD
jgi:glutathione S-transferase